MEVDVGAYIADLLYEHEVVNLPGLGSFTGKYQPANIDHVQEKNLLSLEDAQSAVDQYVRKVRESLNSKEIVIFPKLGRLFKDYEGQLKFISEGANFNTDSFGLPAVQFYPIRQSNEKIEQNLHLPVRDAKTKGGKSADWVQNMVAWFDRNILYFIGATTIFIIFVIYWFFVHKPGQEQPIAVNPNTPEVPGERFNISPSEKEETEVVEPEAPPANPQDNSNPDISFDTEEPTVAPEQKVGIIMIGVFGNPDNVTRLVQRIYEAGYEPYTEKTGRLTRVGVQMAYETEAALQQTLREIQRQFEPNARITKR